MNISSHDFAQRHCISLESWIDFTVQLQGWIAGRCVLCLFGRQQQLDCIESAQSSSGRSYYRHLSVQEPKRWHATFLTEFLATRGALQPPSEQSYAISLSLLNSDKCHGMQLGHMLQSMDNDR